MKRGCVLTSAYRAFDWLNRRWRKANRRAHGGWCRQAQWHADNQQRRLLARTARNEALAT